jgi:hypothetical protein
VALNDRQNTYTSDNHVFNKTSGATVRIGNLSTSSSIINSDLLTINGFNNGTFPAIAYFNTATVQFVVPVQFPVYTRAVANGLAGVVGSQICISDSAGSLSQSTDGMMAFWDTTNNRWSYIHDNNAV